MSLEQQYPILKRLKSLLWRAGMMGLATFVAVLLENLNTLEMQPWMIALAGLALGEVSKWLNTHNRV